MPSSSANMLPQNHLQLPRMRLRAISASASKDDDASDDDGKMVICEDVDSDGSLSLGVLMIACWTISRTRSIALL